MVLKFVIKNHETLATIPHFHASTKRTNKRLVFQIKDGYQLELQMPETMKLFGSTKKKNGQNKKWRNYMKS